MTKNIVFVFYQSVCGAEISPSPDREISAPTFITDKKRENYHKVPHPKSTDSSRVCRKKECGVYTVELIA